MKKRRRPIIVQATIEPGGAQITGENGGSDLPVGMIVPWNCLDSNPAFRWVYDFDGERMEIDGSQVVLRFRSIWKSQSKSTQRLIKQYKSEWYRNPENEFEIDTLPEGFKIPAFQNACIELCYGAMIIFIGAKGFIPALKQPNPIAWTVGHWVVLGVIILGIVLVMSGLVRYFRMLRSSWIMSLRHDGVRVRIHEQERLIPWSKVKMLRRQMVLQPLLIDEQETAYVLPTTDIRSILSGRLSGPQPRLFTSGFFVIFFTALMSGPCVLWFYQYLQIPLTLNWTAVSGVGLIFCGILVLQYYVELKEFRESNESMDHEIPMTP